MSLAISPFDRIPLFDLLWYTTLIYNLILLIKIKYLAKVFHRAYLFWLADLFFSAGLLALTKGWGSPFFVYTLSVLIIFARYSSWKVSSLIFSLWSVLYYLSLVVNGFTPATINKLEQLDIFVAHFFDFFGVIFIITILSKVLDQTDSQREALKREENQVKKAFEKTRQTLAQITTIQKITRSILAQTEVEEIVGITLSFLENLGFPKAALGLVEGESIFHWSQSGRFKKFNKKIPLIEIGNQTALGLALQKKEMVVVTSLHPLAAEVQELIGYPARSAFAFLPLIFENEVQGALLVEAPENKTFSPEQCELLKTLAEQISLAFFHALSYEKIKKTTIAEERNKMSIELHDSVVQELYGLNCLLSSLDTKKRADLEKKVELAKEIVKRSLKNLRLAVIDWESLKWQEDLFNLVKKYTASFEKNTGIEVKLKIDRQPPKLSSLVQRHLFRMIQESYHNIFKHAQAKQIVVTMGYHKNKKHFYIKIKDDGVGFNVRETKKKAEARGLKNLKERAREIKATLSVKSKPSQGCEIKIDLPWALKKR